MCTASLLALAPVARAQQASPASYADEAAAPVAAERADERDTEVTLALNGSLSLTGTARTDLMAPSSVSSNGEVRQLMPDRAVRSDLGPSPGVELHLDVPVHRYVSLGPMVRVQSWSTPVIEAEGSDSAISFDFLFVPRIRLPIVVDDSVLVAYLQAPVGIGIDDVPEPRSIPSGMGTGPSIAFGLGAGLQALLFDSLGFALGLEWMHRWLEVVVEDTHVTGDLVSTGIGPTGVTLDQLAIKPSVLLAF